MGNVQHKMALYVDDILLFLSCPKLSISTTMTVFSEFSAIFGYKINYSKSESMPLGTMSNTDVLVSFC